MPVNKDGAFGKVFAATPLYRGPAPNTPSQRLDGYRETMARLYFNLTAAQHEKLQHYAREAQNPALTQLLGKLNNRQPAISGYYEFLLQDAQHEFRELVDVYSTLAHKHTSYAFGSAPRIFSYRALLINTKQDNQADNFFKLYWYLLRAERLAHLRIPAHMHYNGMVVTGMITDLQQTFQSSDESVVQASFKMLVKNVDVGDSAPNSGLKEPDMDLKADYGGRNPTQTTETPARQVARQGGTAEEKKAVRASPQANAAAAVSRLEDQAAASDAAARVAPKPLKMPSLGGLLLRVR